MKRSPVASRCAYTNITTLGIDPNNGLWFNQERWGLCWYDIEQDKFYDYSNTNSGVHNIGYILRSKQPGEFWLGCRDQPTLYKAKLNSKREIEYLLAKDLYTPKGTTGNITSMYEDSKGNLWVADHQHLICKTGQQRLYHPPNSLCPTLHLLQKTDTVTSGWQPKIPVYIRFL